MEYYNNYENELYHYGIKGMKWGVRKDPKKAQYGYSKKEVKKKIKEAKKNYRRQEDSQHRYSGITGKNWEKVRSEHERDVKSDIALNRAKINKLKYDRLKDEYDPDGDHAEQLAYAYADVKSMKYQHIISDRRSVIGRKYSDQYKDALLKDIGYENIELGRRMLNDYNISNELGKYIDWE